MYEERKNFINSFNKISFDDSNQNAINDKLSLRILTENITFGFKEKNAGPRNIPKDSSPAVIFMTLWGRIWNTVILGINEALLK